MWQGYMFSIQGADTPSAQITHANLAVQHVCESEDREEVVVCELCESSVVSFNQHMKRNHPGCGRSANRQGYRSNGSYVDGWFGGECGSGNPYYLLCGLCRDKYLALKSRSKTAASERCPDSKSGSLHQLLKGLAGERRIPSRVF